jgi:hypothetical protein
VISVRNEAAGPALLPSHWVFQNTSLPLKKARLTPASRAASTFARWSPDQYSSWPFDMSIAWFLIRAPRRAESTPVVYETS